VLCHHLPPHPTARDHQVEAVRSGVQPGLTMVVGPPGTGKTDTGAVGRGEGGGAGGVWIGWEGGWCFNRQHEKPILEICRTLKKCLSNLRHHSTINCFILLFPPPFQPPPTTDPPPTH